MNVIRRLFLGIIIFIILLGATSTNARAPSALMKPSDSEFIQVLPEAKQKDDNWISPKPEIRELPSPSPARISTPKPKKSSHLISGKATYYCLTGVSRCTVGHHGGMYAAIRRNLLFLRGKIITVCKYHTNKCIQVKIIDCNCGRNANLIDLYSDAFKKLSPLYMGRIQVTIKW